MAVIEFNKTKEFIATGIVTLKFDDLRAALMSDEYIFKPSTLSFDDIAAHEITGLGSTGGVLLSAKQMSVNEDNRIELYINSGFYWQDVSATMKGIVIFRDGDANDYSNPLLWWLPTASGTRTLVRSDYELRLQGPLMRW